jgi:hypothetical protein
MRLTTWMSGLTDATDYADALRRRVFCDALAWTEEEGGSVFVGGKDNRVVSFVLPSHLPHADRFDSTRRMQLTRYST